MDADRLRACLEYLGLSYHQFAILVRQDRREVRRWGKDADRNPTPMEVAAWLEQAFAALPQLPSADEWNDYLRDHPAPRPPFQWPDGSWPWRRARGLA